MKKTKQLAKELFRVAREVSFKGNSGLNVRLTPLPNDFFFKTRLLDEGKRCPCLRLTLDICDKRKVEFEHVGTVDVRESWENGSFIVPDTFTQIAHWTIVRCFRLPLEHQWMTGLGFVSENPSCYEGVFQDWTFIVERRVDRERQPWPSDNGYYSYREGARNEVKVILKRPGEINEHVEVNPKGAASMTEMVPLLMYKLMGKAYNIPRIEMLNRLPRPLLDQLVSVSPDEGLEETNEYGTARARHVYGNTRTIRGANGRLIITH